MQGFPYVAGPMSAGGSPVPGVPHVGTPGHPSGITPSLTQYSTPPMAGYPTAGFPQGQPHMMPGAQAPATAFPQQNIAPMPGPAALGPTSIGAPPVPGTGVAGVSMVPFTGVQPPAMTGGPHPLPSLPQLPLPQGFPNPFAISALTPAPQPVAGGPGSQTVMGPQGHLPGLGYFGTPPGAPSPFAGNPFRAVPPPAPTSFPTLPGAQPVGYPPAYAPPQASLPGQFAPPATPQYAVAPQYAAPPQALAPQPPGQANPFWLHLAWQLLQTPAVLEALGEEFQPQLEGPDRMQALQTAVACLTTPQMQSAFSSLTSGGIDQLTFARGFAEQLKSILRAAKGGTR